MHNRSTSSGRYRHTLRRAITGAAAGALALGMVTVEASSSSAATPSLVAVAARPSVPQGARAIGAVSATRSLSGDVALKPSDPAGLQAYATSVSTPSSPNFHHYLSPGAFRARFGPSATAIASVRQALRAAGVAVTSTSSNGLLVGFRAPAGALSSAFHTGFEDYALASGRVATAPTGPLALSSSVAGQVQGVIGLNTFVVPAAVGAPRGGTGHPAAVVPATTSSATSGDPTACSKATAAAQHFGGLTDTAIANAYGVNGLLSSGANGAGQTIAVYELEPFSLSDQQAFDSCYFGASQATAMLSRLDVIPVDGGDATGYGEGESELDIDDVSALAPGANIDVYEAPNTNYGYIDEFNQIVEDDSAKIVTSSWYSGCETQIATDEPGLEQVENTIFEQAAAQGQSILEAAGDDGADGCSIHGSTPTTPLLSSSDPASQPFITSVGGTAITDATDPPAEQVWNDAAVWGAGSGGISAIWGAPSWQTESDVPGFDDHAVVTAAQTVNGGPFCGATVCREIPDVSAQADEFTGAVTVYETPQGGWSTIGGTWSATPLWAAMLADIDSTQACQTNGGVGFVNPALYAIGGSPTEYAASFNDVTQGNNDVFGDTGGLFPATTGYDMGSGLGSPKVTNPNGSPGLAHFLCTAPTDTTATVTGVSPSALTINGGAVTITGTGFESGSTPDVTSIQVGTDVLTSSSFTVTSPTTITATLPTSGAQEGASAPTDGTGTYDVMVHLSDGQSSPPSVSGRITYYLAAPNETPEVDGVQSSAGNEAGGNTVTVYGSGYSSGTGTPVVTFGGVAGTDVTVVSDSELTVVVPAYASGTTTCATALDPMTDVCQVQVQVSTTLGTSPQGQILPEESDAVPADTPTNSEQIAGSTEYDYLPTPTITSISVTSTACSTSNGQVCAGTGGGAVATLKGVGFGVLGLDWVNVGTYSKADSEDFSYDYVSPTEIQVELPSEKASAKELTEPVTVQTDGSPNQAAQGASGPSNAESVTYAPTPSVSSIEVLNDGTAAPIDAGPATGGTTLQVNGKGLQDAIAVVFTDIGPTGSNDGFSDATAYSFTSDSATSVKFQTPSDNPGTDVVQVCDASGCSAITSPKTESVFTYFALGDPVVSSLSSTSGAAGSKLTITGANLGYAIAVKFGSLKATKVKNAPAFLDSGSPSTITVTVPSGVVGSMVPVTVETLGSLVDGSGFSKPSSGARFRFTG